MKGTAWNHRKNDVQSFMNVEGFHASFKKNPQVYHMYPLQYHRETTFFLMYSQMPKISTSLTIAKTIRPPKYFVVSKYLKQLHYYFTAQV